MSRPAGKTNSQLRPTKSRVTILRAWPAMSGPEQADSTKESRMGREKAAAHFTTTISVEPF